jgi:uncharacterized protein
MWFGGEPLLNPRFIIDSTRALEVETSARGLPYAASVITNGERIPSLSHATITSMRLSSAQITLDGPQPIHDLRRPKHGGKGSFNRVVAGVRRFLDLGIAVRLRCTLDADNMPHIRALLNTLDTFSLLDRVQLTFAPVRVDQGSRSDVNCKPATGLEWAAFDADIFRLLADLGLLSRLASLYPQSTYLPCSAQVTDAFVIAPDGLVYKCLNDPPIRTRAIGPLDDPDAVFRNQDDPSTWAGRLRNFAPEETDRCGPCRMLPVCAGGCPASRIAHDDAEQNCTPWRHTLDQRLRVLSGIGAISGEGC